jgi:predicted metal-dependent HD superfamily phosphohydrolase
VTAAVDLIRACAPTRFGGESAVGGERLPDALIEAVVEAYASSDRHYHTLEHVAEVAQQFAAVAAPDAPGWSDPGAVFAAVLAHDAVYDPARRDNEARSAELGRAWCASFLPAVDAERCVALVLATAHHGRPVDGDDLDLALFLDCDLAILGAPPARYDRYEADVVREYAAVYPEAQVRAGRRAFLAAMSARERVFHTDWFEARLGPAARANLQRALAGLDRPA